MTKHKPPGYEEADLERSRPGYWVPVVLWVGFIFMTSTGSYSMQSTGSIIDPILRFFAPSISAEEIVLLHAIIRKLAHVAEYFVFGMLLFRAFRSGSLEPREWRWAFSSLFVLVLFASLDEIHQTLVPERTGSVVDVGMDTVGGLLAQCGCVWWFHRHRGRELVR